MVDGLVALQTFTLFHKFTSHHRPALTIVSAVINCNHDQCVAFINEHTLTTFYFPLHSRTVIWLPGADIVKSNKKEERKSNIKIFVW